MGSKVYQLVTKAYYYLLVSFYFWLGLLRGIVIYSLIPALAALYLTLQFMKQNPDYDEAMIKKTYQSYYKQFQQHRLSSFLVSLGLILLITLIFFFWFEETAWVLIGIAGYFLLLLLSTLSYASYYIAFKSTSIKHSFALGFISVIKNLGLTLAIVIVNGLMLALAYYNLVLFIVLFPVLYGSVIIYALPKKIV
ncbi:hypothetical protein ACS127_07010 [Amphibacillus sp. Q70]|uniref:hypothetical protein n=1 Tax=Amphibacillus sp. Q70 TaxID=3453416 RepID=UPI003F875967